MPAAAARAERPMATRTPLMAITAVQALCRIAKIRLDQLRIRMRANQLLGRSALEMGLS